MNYRIPLALPDWAFLLLVAVVVMVCMGSVGLRLVQALHHRRSVTWPYVRGTVVSSSYRAASLCIWGIGIPGPGGYRLEVKYNYTIDGAEYVGNRISFTHGVIATKALAERTVGSYRSGEDVEVYYCPKRPSLSVLVPKKNT
jgi:hypothetical protein